jgi:hypothetical protein
MSGPYEPAFLPYFVKNPEKMTTGSILVQNSSTFAARLNRVLAGHVQPSIGENSYPQYQLSSKIKN